MRLHSKKPKRRELENGENGKSSNRNLSPTTKSIISDILFTEVRNKQITKSGLESKL